MTTRIEKSTCAGDGDASSLLRKVSVATGLALLATAAASHGSTDYPGAKWVPEPAGEWYTSGHGHKLVVIHDMEGYYASTIPYLQSKSSVSINYCVNGKVDNGESAPAGEITQMVREAYYPFHARCWSSWSHGTEHEGFASNPAWYTDAMYSASAKLQRHLCDSFGIPKDRNHIIAHGQKSVSGWPSWASSTYGSGFDPYCNTHTDPGPNWDWTKFMALIKGSTATAVLPVGPAVVKNSDGRMEVFRVGDDKKLYHKWQTTAGGGWSSGWTSLGGTIKKRISVAKDTGGLVHVFAVDDATTKVFHIRQSPGSPGGWSPWVDRGGDLQDGVVAIPKRDGSMWVVGVNNTTRALNRNFTSSTGGTWAGWFNLGGTVRTGIAAVECSDNLIHVFAVNDTDNRVFHMRQLTGGGWTGWVELTGGNLLPGLVAVSKANGGILVMGVNADTAALNRVLTASPADPWSTWYNLGGTIRNGIAATEDSAGLVHVFAVNDDDNTTRHIRQETGGGWTPWVVFGGSCKATLASARNSANNLEVYGYGPSDDSLNRNVETSPGTWSGWGTISTPLP
jgi:hypothetical protein